MHQNMQTVMPLHARRDKKHCVYKCPMTCTFKKTNQKAEIEHEAEIISQGNKQRSIAHWLRWNDLNTLR